MQHLGILTRLNHSNYTQQLVNPGIIFDGPPSGEALMDILKSEVGINPEHVLSVYEPRVDGNTVRVHSDAHTEYVLTCF
jgi:hypothetical protein